MNTPEPTPMQQAMAAMRPHFRRALWFAIVAGLLMLAPSAYMLEVYGRVVTSRNHYTLLMLTLLVLWAYAIMEVLEWARSRIMHSASVELDRRLGDRLFTAMFTANLRRISGGSPQTMADFRTVRDFLFSPPVLALMEVPVALVFLVLLFVVHPLLGWVSMAGAIVQVVVGWLNDRATQPALKEASHNAQMAQSYADGTLRNAQVIESMGMQKDIHRRWLEKQRRFLALQATASDRGGSYQAVARFVQLVLASALLGLAAWLLLHDQLLGGGGMMIVASILGARVLAPLVVIVTQWRSVIEVRAAWGRLEELLKAVPPKPQAMPLPAARGALQVESLVAAAPGSPAAILRGVGFALQPGEVLAVVGPSASGKTTLARLLVGLWPAASGKVRLDGVDVHTWDKAELGPQVGYLPQGVELFDGTFAENIARFGEVDPAKVEAAARAVGLDEYIRSLPQGYDGPVGSEGAVLSGGQRQRVGLARAIYGDPVFVVLDEPNSSLDETGDAALASAIRELKARGTTFVVMTHRTSILAVADKMLVLKDGQAQAFGPRDEVLGALAKLASQAQQRAAPQPQVASVA